MSIKVNSARVSNKFLKYDEFLVNRIHSQLVNFHLEKHFRYQTLLLLTFVHSNLAHLQKQDPLLFSDNFNISEESTNIYFFEFTNKIMARIYQLIFYSELPRVLEEMRNKLQLSTNPTGDWFIFKDYTILRIYRFKEAPYMLPYFLTTSLFSLEFIRQRLFTEKEHFLKYKKGCNIKFHYTVGPFVIKT